MARITQKEIIAHFRDTFISKNMTKSEYNSWYRMQCIKLKNLKSVVKDFLETNKIDTDKSVEQIIMETIDYAKMKGYKYNSIASLGYDVLPKSIMYWKKAELAASKLEDEAQKQTLSNVEEKAIANNKQLAESRKVPKWLSLDDE